MWQKGDFLKENVLRSISFVVYAIMSPLKRSFYQHSTILF